MADVATVTVSQPSVAAQVLTGDSVELTMGSVLVTVALGVPGPQGPIGPPGDAEPYEQTFASSASWTVNHNLARSVVAQVLSPGGVEVEAAVTYVSVNQLVVSFSTPYAGKVVVR